MLDPTAAEMREFLAPIARQLEADDFDVESAIYWFAADYHGGQGSNLYSALSMSEYRPSPLGRGREWARDWLYDALQGEFGPMTDCFCIRNAGDHALYWSNADGWGELESCDKFKDSERAALNLPVDGEWVAYVA